MTYPPEYREEISLKGLRFTLRHVSPEDVPMFVDGIERCSPVTLYNRFLGAKTRFSQAELEYLTGADGTRHVALIAVYDHPEDGHPVLAGVARAAGYPAPSSKADFGLIVADEFHRLGLGRALLMRLMLAARERGFSALTGEMFATNHSMFNLVDLLPVRTSWLTDGAHVILECDLTTISEGIAEAILLRDRVGG